MMLPRIVKVEPIEKYHLRVLFDDGKEVDYDVSEDIRDIEEFQPLKTEIGLFDCAQLDSSRTCVSWTDQIDLPSDTIYEYGKTVE